MNTYDLFDFMKARFDLKDKEGKERITANLIWRDKDGIVVKKQNAQFGFSSGINPTLTVEMNTVKDIE